MSYPVTSESVTEGFPDKIADQVADAVLDSILAKDPLARVACQVAIANGLVVVMGEITTDCYVDIPRIVRATIKEAGYNRARYGFDADSCGILVSIDEQSSEIGAVDMGGAGDSAIVVGYACDQTPELMPLPVSLAHRLARRLAEVRKTKALAYLRPVGRVQVTIGCQGSEPRLKGVVVSAQHHEEVLIEQVRAEVAEHVVEPVLADLDRDPKARVLVNPSGRFVIGGPSVDVGMTGRRLAIDSYGAWAGPGSGGFSGKDPTKVDRAGAYGARHVAKNVVAAGLASRCQIQIAYAAGMVKPVHLALETFGTEKVPVAAIERAIGKLFDLSPLGIIKELNLRRPLYRPAAVYGHFGRTDIEAPWEDTNRASELRACVGDG